MSLSSLFMSRKRDPICNTIRDSVTNINNTEESQNNEHRNTTIYVTYHIQVV